MKTDEDGCSLFSSIVKLSGMGQCSFNIQSEGDQIIFSIIYPLTLQYYYQYDLLNGFIAFLNQQINIQFVIEILNYSKKQAQIVFRSTFLWDFQQTSGKGHQKEDILRESCIDNKHLKSGIDFTTRIYDKMMLMCKEFTINHSKVVQISHFSQFLSKEIDQNDNSFDTFLDELEKKMESKTLSNTISIQNIGKIIIK